VVVDPLDAYHRLAPPFLNRFEKRTLDWSDVLSVVEINVVKDINCWANDICTEVNVAVLHSLHAGNSNQVSSFIEFLLLLIMRNQRPINLLRMKKAC
jgi:hypothetical protein